MEDFRLLDFIYLSANQSYYYFLSPNVYMLDDICLESDFHIQINKKIKTEREKELKVINVLEVDQECCINNQ